MGVLEGVLENGCSDDETKPKRQKNSVEWNESVAVQKKRFMKKIYIEKLSWRQTPSRI
jgi:hypothetical protein